MDYQWYPGHMTKARRAMEEDMKLIDLVIELLDCRAVLSSRNPDIDTLSKGKSRLILLGKADLADERRNHEWAAWFENRGIATALIDARAGKGMKNISALIEQACREKRERDKRRGILNRPIRAMVAGIPNVGKSTLINSMAGKGVARTGNKPGVTKGKQWIRLNKQVELLDTPGILWPKFEDQDVGRRLALIGSIRDEITDPQELALYLCAWLGREYPDILRERYGIEESGITGTIGTDEITGTGGATGIAGAAGTDGECGEAVWMKLLEQIAIRRAALQRGGEPDLQKAAQILLTDFRSGKLGRISLEICPVGKSG
ncbi:MAG: ribosome biogenesis GTPase YlqF [Lachnospiraceae bacterium]|nr:ribosome biogenesis GTPase YlqF [Lachnospiraceae bacterium]